jgi:hypothetical protein
MMSACGPSLHFVAASLSGKPDISRRVVSSGLVEFDPKPNLSTRCLFL